MPLSGRGYSLPFVFCAFLCLKFPITGIDTYTLCRAQSLSGVQLFMTLRVVVRQAPLSLGFFRQEH